MDIKASDLARELGIPIPVLLSQADAAIQNAFKKGSHSAIEGMTTRSVRKGQVTEVTISLKLADALRQLKKQ